MSSIGLTLGQNVRRLRLARNLSQEELAFRAGLHRTYVSGIERGFRNPTLEVLLKLSHALKTDVSDLLKEESLLG